MPTFRIIFSALLFLSLFNIAQAQELQATVQVDKSRINDASLDYLNDFAGQISSYLNEYKWTNDSFQEKEKINVRIQVNFLSVSDDRTFKAAIVIRSLRPIYNTIQQTPIFLYNDQNWTFNYTPNRSFVHDELQFDAITTLLDFYAYVIIGYDYDTFSPLGGDPYFTQAQNLVSLAQQSSSEGWERSATIPRNRARLMANLLNPSYENLRRASYTYHRKGLDEFTDDPPAARQHIFKSLKEIQAVSRQTTNNLLINTFFNAKSQEIAAVFKDAPTELRLKVFNLLNDIDPAHRNDYDNLSQ